jgi:hypothetical protein
MAAHRYWRAVGLEAYGAGDLELSCFHLLDLVDTRVDAPATLAASTAPSTGVLSNLQDDDLATAALWPTQSVATLTLTWDFGGSPVEVGYAQLAGNTEARFLLVVKLQFSDNAVDWVDSVTAAGVQWPGKGAKTETYTTTGKWSRTDRGLSTSLNAEGDTVSTWNVYSARAVVPKSSGTVQFEVLVGPSVSTYPTVGVGTATMSLITVPGGGAGGWAYCGNGSKLLAGSASAYGATYTAGAVIGVVVNFATGAITFYKNGVSQGVASASAALGLTLFPVVGDNVNTSTRSDYTLIGENFTYPVAGADPWLGVLSTRANKASRTVSTDPVSAGASPPIIYGAQNLVEPAHLTVQSGAIKDYTTGMLGTGRGRVSGTVKQKGTPDAPVHRQVRLIREKDGLVLRGGDDCWSDPVTGAYSFDYIDELQSWAVVAHDHTFAFRDQIASNLTLANGGVELIP